MKALSASYTASTLVSHFRSCFCVLAKQPTSRPRAFGTEIRSSIRASVCSSCVRKGCKAQIEVVPCLLNHRPLDQDRHLATGDYAGGLAIWDLENLKKPVWSGRPREDYAAYTMYKHTCAHVYQRYANI